MHKSTGPYLVSYILPLIHSHTRHSVTPLAADAGLTGLEGWRAFSLGDGIIVINMLCKTRQQITHPLLSSHHWSENREHQESIRRASGEDQRPACQAVPRLLSL